MIKKNKIIIGVSAAVLAAGITTAVITTHDDSEDKNKTTISNANKPLDADKNAKAEAQLKERQSKVTIVENPENIENSQTEISPEEAFTSANEAWSKGDYAKASTLYTRALESENSDIQEQAKNNLDLVLKQSQEFVDATTSAENSPVEVPAAPISDDKKVYAQVPQGEIKKDVTVASGNPEKNYNKAWEALSSGDQDKALEYYRSAQSSKDQTIAQNARAMAEALSLGTASGPIHISPANTLKTGTTTVKQDGIFMFADIGLQVKAGDKVVVEKADHFASATVTSDNSQPITYTTVVS